HRRRPQSRAHRGSGRALWRAVHRRRDRRQAVGARVVGGLHPWRGARQRPPESREGYIHVGRAPPGMDAIDWAREAADRGAGEILLTSMDRDGARTGFDCALTSAVSSAVSIPVIASGGAGTFEHFHEVFTAGQADAALAASVFHFSEHAVSE